MKKVMKEIYRKIISWLPTKLVINIETLRGYHKLCDLNNPIYFGEKIQWLKLYGNLEKYTNFADKYLVRDYITEKVGDKYLVRLLGVFDNAEEINFEKLPNQFVIKLNTGSGFNIVVTDKQKINSNKIVKQLDKWMKIDYFKIKKEPQYKNIQKKIIIEEYISDKNGKLNDYKFFCFDGKVEFIEVDSDRFGNHTMDFFDKDWKLLQLKKGKYKNSSNLPKRPEKFNKMINIAEQLASDFQFVRVDLYNVEGSIYFGELTFTPAGGLTKFNPIEKDREFAKKIITQSTKKILLAASTSKKKNRLDGVTIKSRVLEEFLLNQEGITLYSVDTDNYKRDFFPIILKLVFGIRKCDKIVICSSSPGAAKLLSFLRKIKCKKEIYYFVAGGVIGDKIRDHVYDIRNYACLTHIFVESEKLKKQLNNLSLNNVSQLNNFRYIKKFKNNYKNTNEYKFVFFARVNKQKGVEECIRVVQDINKKTKHHVTLDIYGQCTSEYLEELQKMFDENIHYKGAVTPNNKREYEVLSEYDVLLFPTKYYNEGLPGTIIEAYIASLAIVASEWKYAHEYISDSKNGYISNFNDYNDFYQKALNILDRKKIEKFKKYSKELSKRFNIEYLLSDFIVELKK